MAETIQPVSVRVEDSEYKMCTPLKKCAPFVRPEENPYPSISGIHRADHISSQTGPVPLFPGFDVQASYGPPEAQSESYNRCHDPRSPRGTCVSVQASQDTRTNIPEASRIDWSALTDPRAARPESEKSVPICENNSVWSSQSSQLDDRTHMVSLTDLVLCI